uniref:Protein GAMETE EXPRESSED 1 n=1 Tax=Aegilops tauschii subsp. strangulata TaxID=200361 RepID=A0A453KTV2_AEGTS
FSMDVTNNPRGVKLLENARNKLAGPKNCWQDAYRNLFASCGEIMADKERQARLAWHLSSCYQEDSGRPAFPSCAGGSRMVHCRKKLGDSESKVFLEFFLETNTLCHQLQAEAFKHSTERLVNDLTRSSKSAEEKLEVIEARSEEIIKESGKVRDALSSIEAQADRLAETSKGVGAQIDDVLAHSRTISDQSKEIAASQAELKEGQAEMRKKIEAGMERIQESYDKLGDGMGKLTEEAVGIQKEIATVGDLMSSKMLVLQGTADEIGNVAGKSLENQMQLLDGQNKAMDGLTSLHIFQSQALEESRETLEKFALFGQRQQEELLSKQEQIRQAHDHLILNSHSILAAQEEFRAKQANIFAALDKLYILHNAILAESRFIKAFFFYCCIVFIIYMLTSLCITLLLEMGLIKFAAGNFDNQFWVLSKVFLVRLLFLAAATIQILHSIFTFRDYEVLNHRLLQTLVEKVRTLEKNAGDRMLSYGSESDESLRNYSWVFDELTDEADSTADPNYALPAQTRRRYNALPEEVAENSITTS